MEKIFADGFSFREKHPNAPEFIVGSIHVNPDKAMPFLNKHKNDRGWVTLQIKQSKNGTYYLELDQWEKPESLEKKVETIEYPEEDINADDIPF